MALFLVTLSTTSANSFGGRGILEGVTARVSPESVLDELEGLRALARSLVHGDAEADDLLQDTAVAAIMHPPGADRPARPWLATVLRNRWRMNRRTEARRRVREHEVAGACGDAEVRGVDGAIDRARVLEKLSRALVALDEPFRTVVIRRYLDGESAADIARSLGVPAGTVRWRLKTGLERLRSSLDESSPRWQRALVPFTVGPGAIAVKTKTSLLWLLVLVLALGGGLVVVLKGKSDGTATTSTVASGRVRGATVPANEPGASPAPAATGSAVATHEVDDPLPGQGKVKVDVVPGSPGAVSGRVINWSTGDGVAGAELTFTGEAGASTVRTRDDGAFELSPGTPGRFILTTVTAPGFLPYAPELQHSGVHAFLAKDRSVRGLTVFLFPAVDYIGRVVDARGAPVSGARVRLLGTGAGEQQIEKLSTEWTSDKDGKFVFHAADDAVLEAVRGTQRGWSRLDGNVAITKHIEIKLGDGAARELTIRGRVVDSANQPVDDVLLTAFPDEPPGKEPASPRAASFATSNADGTFVIENLDSGTYLVRAEADDRAGVNKRDVRGGTTNLVISMDGGEVIAGNVVSSTGEPIPSFTLLVLRAEGIAREGVMARSIVEPSGKFSVHVPPGDYELVASASGWAPSPATSVSAGTKDAKLVMSAGATLRGTVVDKDSGEPLQYVRVMREGLGGGASAIPANAGTVTRADGTFELTGLRPGPVAVSFGGGGYHPRVEAGLTALDGGVLGPLTIQLKKLAPGEQPQLELVGIGVKLAGDGDALRVDLVMPSSGAEAAGMVAGDRIVALDGVPITTLGFDGAIARIRGVEGTKIAVTVLRGGQPVQLVVERKKLRA
ncbi:MAG: sigma-70 family RNA polymerase sigma factor [Kofleriaceae bacterium]|nr:sigma-70 family RNA polymerase sigma factor [Kofleriaceae bacterium]